MGKFDNIPLSLADLDYVLDQVNNTGKSLDDYLTKLSSLAGNLADIEEILEGEPELLKVKELKQRLMKTLQDLNQINVNLSMLTGQLQIKRGPGPS